MNRRSLSRLVGFSTLLIGLSAVLLTAEDNKTSAPVPPPAAPSAVPTPTPPPKPPVSLMEQLVLEKWPTSIKTPSGLRYMVMTPGQGLRKPQAGQTVEAAYVGKFISGKVFDASPKDRPFSFKLGQGQVIKGWDEALQDMVEGEKRLIVLPPDLAYGARGSGNRIPPYTWLVFEVELVRIVEEPAAP